MHKSKKILLALLCSFLFIGGANAECDYETEVNMAKEASNIKANYEVKDIVIDATTGEEVSGINPEDVDFESDYANWKKITVSIYNITKDMNVLITGDDGSTETITYDETDNGTYSFDRLDLEKVVNYEIKVTTTNPSCSGKELRTLNLLTPKRNDFHYLTACIGNDDYYCQEFVDYDLNMSEGDIISKAASKQNGTDSSNTSNNETKNWFEKTKEYLKENKWVIYTGVGVIVLIAGVATTVIVIKKRRSKVL